LALRAQSLLTLSGDQITQEREQRHIVELPAHAAGNALLQGFELVLAEHVHSICV
jgi:hypothetical protein